MSRSAASCLRHRSSEEVVEEKTTYAIIIEVVPDEKHVAVLKGGEKR
jgi:hypothetical protein